ncbi:MAG: hypothetical protein AB1644_02690 [Candidatus Zixiibacteriota bacterium]
MFAAILSLLSTIAAQENAPTPGNYPSVPPPVVAANYTIRARVLVDSSLIRGDWELGYQNRTNETLRELYLNLPHWKKSKNGESRTLVCSLDSLLVNGTPTVVQVEKGDSSKARIALDNPLQPLETLFLLAAFTTRFSPNMMSGTNLDMPAVYMVWHPSIATFFKGKWYAGKKVRKVGWRGELGHFNVALTVDSSFELVGPGELANEIQIYGLLPSPRHDTVILNITRSRQKGDPVVPPLVFPTGEKTYAWRFRSAWAFPIALGRNLVCDRAFHGGSMVSLWYPETAAGDVGDSSTLLVSEIAKLMFSGASSDMYPNLQSSVIVGEIQGTPVRMIGLWPVEADRTTGMIDRRKIIEGMAITLITAQGTADHR